MFIDEDLTPDVEYSLSLTTAERKLLLESLPELSPEVQQLLRKTPAQKPLVVTVDQLDELGGSLALQSYQCADKEQAAKLRAIFASHFVEAMNSDDAGEDDAEFDAASLAEELAGQAEGLVQFHATALDIVRSSTLADEPVEGFHPTAAQRALVLEAEDLPEPIRKKFAEEVPTFTLVECVTTVLEIAKNLPDDDLLQRAAMIHVGQQITRRMDAMLAELLGPELLRESKPPTEAIYQFKITLQGVQPPIWRRIQVRDCTLDYLHYHIQCAMAWEDAHLHQFKIRKQIYGDPELLDDGFGPPLVDSTVTLLSEILAKARKGFKFSYEYDFGDSWMHEIEYEGSPPPEPDVAYPRCLAGARACPLEDCGGIYGYMKLVEAFREPTDDNAETREWCGEEFDPEEFDAESTTKAMQWDGEMDEDDDEEDEEEEES